MRFADLVDEVARRSQVSGADVRRSNVPDAVNRALETFSQKNQAGWDWLLHDVDVPMVADQTEYTFDSIRALIPANVDLAAEEDKYPLVRIDTAHLLNANGERTWFCPLTRAELEAGCESGWTASGQALRVHPAPDGTETLRLRVLIGERTLDADDETPLCPDLYRESIVQYARSVIYEEKGDDERAAASRKLADEAFARAVGFARAMG